MLFFKDIYHWRKGVQTLSGFTEHSFISPKTVKRSFENSALTAVNWRKRTIDEEK